MSNNNNIFRINNEYHIFEIMENNKDKLILLGFISSISSLDHEPSLTLFMSSISNKFKDCMFLYVDVNDYMTRNILSLNTVPQVFIIFNKNILCSITELDYDEIYMYFNKSYNNIYKNKHIDEKIKEKTKKNIKNTSKIMKDHEYKHNHKNSNTELPTII